MKKSCFLFLATLIALISFNKLGAQPVSKKDSLALVNLYDSTYGWNWRHSKNWLSGPVSTWYGVTVVDTSVVSINLGTNGLGGTLPLSIGDLSNLNTLYLNDNHIFGTIPETIGNLVNLQYLSFYNNNFKGAIPVSIGNCINLLQFQVSYNQLQIIPSSLCYCINLHWLDLDNNSFKTLPDSIGNLSQLFFLEVNNNNLKDSIPQSIGSLTNLYGLNLSWNSLKGPIPESIGNLANVTTIDLNHNNLTGEIPSSIGNLSNLQSLDLSNNSLDGEIPNSIGNLSNIQILYLHVNKLVGQIPSSLGKLDTLRELNLQSNKLTGNIPASLTRLKNAYDMHLDNNQLTGNIPAGFAGIHKHFNLSVTYNHLSENKNVTSSVFENDKFYASIDHNWFTFDGLEFVASHLPMVTYSPQSRINIHQHDNYLSVYAGGTLSNNTYKWFKLGKQGYKIIVGDSLFHPSEPGLYHAEITNAIATKLILKTDTFSYTIPSAVNGNIAYDNLDKSIMISPNPATKNLHIEGLSSTQKTKFTVVDITGNIKLQTIVNSTSYNLNIATLQAGNYLLKIEMNDEIVTKQFVKE